MSTAALTKKLVKVMNELGRIKKNGYNSFHSYAYVTEADVLDAARKALIDNNVFITQSVDEVRMINDTTTMVSISNTLTDADSGESTTIKSVGFGQDKGDKGVYKAITGATKYFFMKNFLLPTGDDPEATDETGKKTSVKLVEPKVSSGTITVNGNGEATVTVDLPKKKVSFSKKAFPKPEAVSNEGDL